MPVEAQLWLRLTFMPILLGTRGMVMVTNGHHGNVAESTRGAQTKWQQRVRTLRI